MSAPWLRAAVVPTGTAVLELLPALRAALDGTGPALAPHAVAADPPALGDAAAEALPDGLALAVGTSGSTGHPKRALLTAAALRASADATHERLGGPGQWLLAMPAHHIAGLQVLVRSLVAGTSPVIVDVAGGFTAEAFAAATTLLDPGAGPLYTALVPTQLGRLLGGTVGLQALRAYAGILLGGAAAPPTLLAAAAGAGLVVHTTYGMSETAGGCVYDGLTLTSVRVRLDHDGRVGLGGPTVASGYLGEPARTAEAFGTDARSVRWFRTDDVGHLDAGGRLHVDGRLDDLVNTGGVKVAPRVVEEALGAHVPGVLEAVVVGTPDPEWGEVVSAALVLAPDAPPVTVRGVRARLRGILPDPALPRRLVTLDTLPLRGPGKPDRAAIRGHFTRACPATGKIGVDR